MKDADATKVGRRFSNAVIELFLASYAGFFTTTPPSSESEFGVYWPALVPVGAVEHAVILPDGTRVVVPPTDVPTRPPRGAPTAHALGDQAPAAESVDASLADDEPVVRAPLGVVCGARSGDKGGNANVGIWTWTDEAYEWLCRFLTVERVRALIPETAPLAVRRYELPNLRACNFVVEGILGEGVASSVRFDPQAKGLGEFLRSRFVDVPRRLVVESPGKDPRIGGP